MKSPLKLKEFNRAFARNSLYAVSWCFNRLPFWAIRFFSYLLVSIAFYFIKKQRKIAQESLDIAFGQEKSAQDVNNIIKKCFRNFGYGMIEMFYFMAHPQLINPQVALEGKEHIEAAFKQGKGIIAVTAHFGNFPLMMLRCIREGYKVNVILRHMRDQKFEEFLAKKRSEVGLKSIYAIPRRECVKTSLEALKNNEMVFIPLDQNFGSKGGVFVDFFGQKAATATGPVVFARRSNAVILPMFVVRQKDDTHKIIVEPPLELEEGKDDEDVKLVNTAKITKIIEKYIRKYPEEWGWMHRRWKSRPKTR